MGSDQNTEQTKAKRIPFNAVDVIILLVVVGAAAFFLWRYVLTPRNEAEALKKHPHHAYTLVMDHVDIPNDHFEGKIQIGDSAFDKTTGVKIGILREIQTEPARSHVATDDGRYVLAPREGYSRLILTIEGDGWFPPDGGMQNGELLMFTNKSFEVNVGDDAIVLRLVNIIKGDELSGAAQS